MKIINQFIKNFLIIGTLASTSHGTEVSDIENYGATNRDPSYSFTQNGIQAPTPDAFYEVTIGSHAKPFYSPKRIGSIEQRERGSCSDYSPVFEGGYQNASSQLNQQYQFSTSTSDCCRLKACGIGSCVGLTTAAIIGTVMISPLLARFSDQSQEVALASAVWNLMGCVASCCTKTKEKYGTAPMLVAATVCSWIYWANWQNLGMQNNELRIANIVLTTIPVCIIIPCLLCVGFCVGFVTLAK